MALVIFLRGVNVGGHRTFRPSILAERLKEHEAINIGAAGTLVVRKPPSQRALRDELRRILPFETDVMLCRGRDLLDLESENPFGRGPVRPDIVRFVSILATRPPETLKVPIELPAEGEWMLRILDIRGRFAIGMYRRHMKAIGYLGAVDKIVGVPATTRNWNTITRIIKLLKNDRLQR